MKKILLFITLTLAAVSINAQEIVVDTLDTFRGIHYVQSEWEKLYVPKLGMNGAVAIAWAVENGTPCMMMYYYGPFYTEINAGTHFFYFEFEDGTVMKLPCITGDVSKMATEQMSKNTNYHLYTKYALSASDIKKFKERLITKFSVDLGNKGSYVVNPKYAPWGITPGQFGGIPNDRNKAHVRSLFRALPDELITQSAQ